MCVFLGAVWNEDDAKQWLCTKWACFVNIDG